VLGEEEAELPVTEGISLGLSFEEGEGREGERRSAISESCPADFSKTIYSFVVCNPG